MRLPLLHSITFAALTAAPLMAETPKVVTDIAPLHGLAARVMKGAGEPAVLVRPGSSPHHYALRPSDAQALQDADLIFFVGHDLTPWLVEPLETLAPQAAHIELMEASGTQLLKPRNDPRFERHNHGDDEHEGEHERHEEHDDDHADDAHKEHAHDEQSDAHHEDEHNGHAHALKFDPHAWLDPENAKTWMRVMAEQLSERDPDNAALYQQNAREGAAEIDAAITGTHFNPEGIGRYVVFHDAYQYFEHRFGVSPVGAISLGDGQTPGPARIAEIQQIVTELDVSCVFAEPQFSDALIDTVFDGRNLIRGEIDPLGSQLEQGSDFYPALMVTLAKSLSQCK